MLLFAGRLLFVGEKLTLTNFFRSIDSLRLISMLLQTPPPLLKVPSTMLISGGSTLQAGHFSLQQVDFKSNFPSPFDEIVYRASYNSIIINY